MARFDLKTYALQGARSRAEELQSELRDIYRLFPELRGQAGRRATSRTTAVRRRRSRMTAAQRKEVSARMKKYWAERRKATK